MKNCYRINFLMHDKCQRTFRNQYLACALHKSAHAPIVSKYVLNGRKEQEVEIREQNDDDNNNNININ